MATPTEVSDRLDIPPATLRRYVSLFGEHLSEEARRPRGRQFDDGDIETLSRIRELFASGQSTDQVLESLGGSPAAPTEQAAPRAPEAPPPGRLRPEPSAAPAADTEEAASEDEAPQMRRPQPRQFPRSEPVRSSLEAQKLSAKPVAGIDKLSQKLALNEDRVSRADERLSVLEYRLTRIEEWLKMPWYKRLLSRPPLYDL